MDPNGILIWWELNISRQRHKLYRNVHICTFICMCISYRVTKHVKKEHISMQVSQSYKSADQMMKHSHCKCLTTKPDHNLALVKQWQNTVIMKIPFHTINFGNTLYTGCIYLLLAIKHTDISKENVSWW